MQQSHEDFMLRCLQLAELGAGHVAPNPMVGAVLVYNGKIIGEGYHKKYGQAHAEVNCFQSVKEADKHLIKDAVLYVSLEPCNHFGNTPPCTDLIIESKICKVVIGCQDSFTKVDGKGIKKLKDNSIEVIVGVLENECKELNKRFFLFHSLKRPYVILKWAQTANNKIASDTNNRLLINNFLSNKLVHKWRFEEAGILIGTNTAQLDDPFLTNRLWKNKNPVRLIIDKNFKLNRSLKIFNSNISTILFTNNKNIKEFPIINIMLSKENSVSPSSLLNQPYVYIIEQAKDIIKEILKACYQLNIQSILVEGGAKTLQSFIEAGLLDEIRVIRNTELFVEKGLNAPIFSNCIKTKNFRLIDDEIEFFKNSKIKT